MKFRTACMIVLHKILRVSGLHDNGSTPLQGQEDDQSVAVSTSENAIDDDVTDIRTIYPPWSIETNDMCNSIEIANDKSMKDIRDEICKDTSLKTEINKPCIDNIDAYVMIWKEFSRLPDFFLYLSNTDTTLVVHGLRFQLW